MANKLETLEQRKLKLEEEIAREREAEESHRIFMGAYAKLRGVAMHLSSEERAAVDGMYLFLHRDNGVISVDLVRKIPAATDKGQGKTMEKTLALREKSGKN